MSDLSQLISDFYIGNTQVGFVALLISRLNASNKFFLLILYLFYDSGILKAFEELRIIRDYRSPFSTRAFIKVMTFLIPIILCPFYIEISHNVPKSEKWAPYVIAVVFSFTLGTLQSVQDRLYDPFIPPTIDSINVKEVSIYCILSILNFSQ